MRTLLTTNYLREKGVSELCLSKSLKAVNSRIYPNLVLFKYSQIESDFSDPVVKECRGLILDSAKDWLPVCYSFRKFMNIQEKEADKIDFDNARVQSKLDGSLINLWFYNNKWNVSTTGSPDASGEVSDWTFTFKDLFWKVFNEKGYSLPEDTDSIYFFELTTPYNRVVVNHTEPKITLLGSRSMETLKEMPVHHLKGLGFPIVEEHDFQNIEAVLAKCKTLKGFDAEGYVVCDSQFNRVKIKAPDYVRLHRFVSGYSFRNLVDVIRSGELSEVESVLGDVMFSEAEAVKNGLDSLIKESEEYFYQINQLQTQKEFALEAVKRPYSGALFSVRNKRTDSFKSYYSEMGIDSLINILTSMGYVSDRISIGANPDSIN